MSLPKRPWIQAGTTGTESDRGSRCFGRLLCMNWADTDGVRERDGRMQRPGGRFEGGLQRVREGWGMGRWWVVVVWWWEDG